MIPDPAAAPLKPWRQVLFGLSIAAVYGSLFVLHVVYGLFIALAGASAVRGIGLYCAALTRNRSAAEVRGLRPVAAATAAEGD